MWSKRAGAVLGLCLLTTLGAVAQDVTARWAVLSEERGIVVSRREQPGAALPAFRGRGVLSADYKQMLRVMLDIDEVTHWAYGVDEAKLLKRISARSDLIYLYSDLPWPVRDRDMIVRRDIELVKQGSEVRIHLRCAPEALPKRSGRVRVERCESSFTVRRGKDGATELDYIMTLDPGGALPGWAGNWVAAHVPFRTLVAVEERSAIADGHEETEKRFAWVF